MVTRSELVSGIEFVGLGVDELIGHNHFVPGDDEIDTDIVGYIEVSVHPQETRERSVDRVVEVRGVETGEALLTQEELRLVLGEVDSRSKVRGSQRWRTTSTDVQGTKGVTTSDFSRDEKVVLSELPSTCSSVIRPLSHEVDSHLCGLIDSDTVNVECLDG